jgi:hypothetical protein
MTLVEYSGQSAHRGATSTSDPTERNELVALPKLRRGPNLEFAIAALVALGPVILSIRGTPVSPLWSGIIWLLVYICTVPAIFSLRIRFVFKVVLCIALLLAGFAAWQATSAWVEK